MSLLLLGWFVALTCLALGSDGISSLSVRTVGIDLVPSFDAGQALVERTPQQALQIAERDAKRQRLLERDGPGFFDRFALVSLPPLSAEPFSPLIGHAYASLALFLTRRFVCRPAWHALLWWHILCACACVGIIARWRMHRLRVDSGPDHGSRSAAAVDDGRTTDPPVPRARLLPTSPVVLLLHASYWFAYALVFGWPAVHLLLQPACALRVSASARRAKAS